MAVALVVETGAGVPGANSLCSIEFADAYHEVRLEGAAWAAADADTKAKALISATAILSAVPEWDGIKVNRDQALAWPRFGVCEVYGDEIPANLQKATAELAKILLSEDKTADADGIKRVKVDVIEVEFKVGTSKSFMTAYVRQLLTGLIKSTGGSNWGVARVVRS